MTRDTGGLRQFLQIALALGACTKASNDAPVPKVADARAAIARPVDAAAPGPSYRVSPVTEHGCLVGDWCGSAATAKTMADRDAGVELGCVPSFYGVIADRQRPVEAMLQPSDTQAKRDLGDADTCCYSWIEPCPGGRALRDGERVVVAEADAVTGTLAMAWLADALAEHASIASFARTTIELMAVGAPPSLLADVQRAALDEIRHAEACFALASRYAGRVLAPGPLEALAPRASDRLAIDTFLEGCVGETIAALAATRALAGCEDPEVASVLRMIVDDESRHAALAWRTLAWLVARGGDDVRVALRAIEPPARRVGRRDPALARHGRLDEAAALAAAHDAWHEIILPTLAEVILGTS